MNIRMATGIGALALLAGAVGPWASVFGAISVGPTAGVETSIVVFGGIVVLALVAILDRAYRPASITIGVLAMAEAVYALARIQQAKADADDWGALVQPGWGLYLTIIAGLFLVASTFIIKPKPAATVVAAT
jgi:hypothetical protein